MAGSGAQWDVGNQQSNSTSTMDRFCGGRGMFGPWANDEAHRLDPHWHTDNDFSTCFENVVLAPIPAGFLLLAVVLHLIAQHSKPAPTKTFRVTSLCMAKQVFAALFACCAAGELVQRLITHAHEYQLVAPSVMLFGALLAIYFLQHEFRRGAINVGTLTLFWFFTIVIDGIRLFTNVHMHMHDIHRWEATGLLAGRLVFAIVSFVLSNISEKLYEVRPRECPEDKANLLSVITFWWLNPLMTTGYKRPLEGDDLWELNPSDQAISLSTVFQSYWTKEVQSAKPSMLRAMRHAFGGPFFFAAFFKFIQDTLAFVAPQLLRLLMRFIQAKDAPEWHGYALAAAMLGAAIIQSFCLHQYFHRVFVTGMRLRSALITAVYQKSLRLSVASRQEATTGEIVNLMSTDAQRFNDATPYLHVLWSGPYQIALSLYFLWDLMSWATLAGVGVMILMIPVNGAIAKWSRSLQVTQMKRKDDRIKLMNEVLNGIRVIKMYAWERPYAQFVRLVRGKELEVLKTGAYLDGISAFSWTVTPFLVSLVTFIVYTNFIGDLTPEKAFVSLSLFNLLRFPLAVVPFVITSVVQVSVSLKRLRKFLLLPEYDPDDVIREQFDERRPVCEIKNGDFAWDSKANTLHNINFEVMPREVVAIVGRVGCGKSSLVSAMLGDIPKKNGVVSVRGTVAYVPQQAWIQNGTVRDNILFGREYDEKRYKQVLWACALEDDLEILDAGDLTEIGEKGINLSGGQKQRISLARAVYHDCDLYLLDDPLSAVDSHVGKHIYKHVIGQNGLLKDKARVLVTHLVQFLPSVDKVFVVEGGVISERGTYTQLVENKGDFAKFLEEHMTEQQQSESTSPMKQASSAQEESKAKEADLQAKGALTSAETSELGSVKGDVYVAYLKALGIPLCIVLLLLFLATYAAQAASSFWLAYWSDEADKHPVKTKDKLSLYLGVYAACGLGNAFGMLASTIVMALGAIYASRRLHESMLNSVLRSPMSFFDTTPMGRILNRFAQDINVIDQKIPSTVRSFVRTALQVLSVIAVISYSTPIFLAAVVPLSFFYAFVQRYYVASSRQLKRLGSVRRSPIFAHFSETLSGTSCIRAYERQQDFIAENEIRVDSNLEAWYPSIASNRWLAVRLEFVGNCIIFFAAMFAVIERHKLSPSIVGLSVSYAMTVTQTLNWMVRMSSDLETDIVAVERVQEYTQLKPEAPLETDRKVSPDWPPEGMIEFCDVKARYRDGLPLVLRGVSFEVNPGEKVGIVGRTGAGKSSLTITLFRIIEAAGGRVIVDGEDISKLGLEDLRSRLTIMPQDPILFCGSVRDNLDPFRSYDDDTLWRALETSHLKDTIAALEGGLDGEVSEGGSNFSVGQRQLLCLARAVLRKTKVLVLDEATAAVDFKTDQLIQNTIREVFAGCTILVIAHRLNTIMDSDRVLVLSQGQVVEYDSPQTLLLDPNSHFCNMARAAGITAASASAIN